MQQMLHYLEQMRWKSNNVGCIYKLTQLFNHSNAGDYDKFI